MAARRTVPKRKQPAPKPWKQYGFRSEKAYRDWLKHHSKLPKSDPLYFTPSHRGKRRGDDIARIQRMAKRKKSEPKNMRRKAMVLVYEKEQMSPFNFLDRYLEQMRAMLQDPNVSAYDKRVLRKVIKQLTDDERDINEDKLPGEQLTMFR